jgi:hypothetical protein
MAQEPSPMTLDAKSKFIRLWQAGVIDWTQYDALKA